VTKELTTNARVSKQTLFFPRGSVSETTDARWGRKGDKLNRSPPYSVVKLPAEKETRLEKIYIKVGPKSRREQDQNTGAYIVMDQKH